MTDFLDTLAARGAGLAPAGEGVSLLLPRPRARFEPEWAGACPVVVQAATAAAETSRLPSAQAPFRAPATASGRHNEPAEGPPRAHAAAGGDGPAVPVPRPLPEQPPAAESERSPRPTSPDADDTGDVPPAIATRPRPVCEPGRTGAAENARETGAKPSPAAELAGRALPPATPRGDVARASRAGTASVCGAQEGRAPRRSLDGSDEARRQAPDVRDGAPAPGPSPSSRAAVPEPVRAEICTPALSVSIGRIEVEVAPLSPARAAPERSRGFDAYSRARRGRRR